MKLVLNEQVVTKTGSLAGQTLIIGAKESGEIHVKVVSHDGMLSCQSDLL